MDSLYSQQTPSTNGPKFILVLFTILAQKGATVLTKLPVHAVILHEYLGLTARHILEHLDGCLCCQAKSPSHRHLAGVAVTQRCSGIVEGVECEFVADSAACATTPEFRHVVMFRLRTRSSSVVFRLRCRECRHILIILVIAEMISDAWNPNCASDWTAWFT